MIKGLERVFQLRLDINTAKDKLKDIEKELQALEIIQKHKLLNYILKNKKCAVMYHLHNEEIDLLKEVLNDH